MQEKSENKPFRCLVTGYGPFGIIEDEVLNASYEIAIHLDGEYLTNSPKFNANDETSASKGRSIMITSYLNAIRTSYSVVSEIVPQLHRIQWDSIVHLGLNAGEPYVSVVRSASKKGHIVRDIDGNLPALPTGFNSHYDRGFAAGYEHLQDKLQCAAIDTGAIVSKLKAAGFENCVESHDAGGFLCNFIFYASLAEAAKPRPPKLPPAPMVQFVHVPEIGKKGKDITFNLENMSQAIKHIIYSIANP